MMHTPVTAAFIALTDAAPLIAAATQGFAADEGIALSLVRESSWATVRDRLAYRQVEAAHMPAPLAVAVTLGLSQHPVALAAPFKLNINGNALTMARDFAAALDPDRIRRVADPEAAAHDFAGAIGLWHRKPVLGVVHRFSSQALMLRYWLAYAGIDPDRDVALRVLPPSLMATALGSGEIDGFVAGEPWGSVAVDQGMGEIAALGANIWRRGIEKVVAMRRDWMEANPDAVDRLLRAFARAAEWCDDPANHEQLAHILSRPEHIGEPAARILPALAGRLPLEPCGAPAIIPDFLLFHREAANFPWRSQALWIYSQFVRWGMLAPSSDTERAAADVFRSDVYRRALQDSAAVMPGASLKVEGALAEPLPAGAHQGVLTLGPDRFFDGRVFDPAAIESYLASFGTR